MNNRLISQRAFVIWESAGKPQGHALDHWLQAEREILSKESAAKKSPLVDSTTKAPKKTARSKKV